ncbi:MAG: DPP IV N-terminal domain-containing protein [Bacteroidales bacterium]
MKNICLFVFVFLFGFLAFGQAQKLNLSDIYLNPRKFYPENISLLKWKDGAHYTYVKNRTDLMLTDVKKSTEDVFLTVSKINEALEKEKLPKLNNFPDYEWETSTLLKFENSGYLILYQLDANKISLSIKMDEKADNTTYCAANQKLAFTIENNLYYTEAGNKTVKITDDPDKGIVNGDANVHRQEFGIDRGIFWSPAGNFVAFYRKDETMVADYPLVDITTRIATLKNNKYPMAGEKSEQVTLGVYNLKTGSTVFMKTGLPVDHYLTCITWDPSEKYIYIAELNREQNHLKLNKYDVTTGDFVQTLFEESHPKYVEPEHPLYFMKTKPDQFAWFSERDGYNHLYLYNTSGKLLKQLTSGKYVVTDFLGFDNKDENFYALTTMASPLESNLYKYSVKDGKNKRLTLENGTHQVSLSSDFNYFIDNFSSSATPRKIVLYDNNGKVLKDLLVSKNPLSAYNLGQMVFGTLKAADGTTDLYYRMIKPVDFDSTKKYPVVVYVYGGPHAQLVTNSWLGGARLWEYYMAQNGYLMFTIDNRGSDNRGLDFENVIHRECGKEEVKDQMKGIEFLKSLPYVDKDKIGVHGWSYGGFMTISLMLNNPETFKVACAGGPVTDWKYYEVMYGERYMDTPQENPEGYKNSSVLNKAQNLKGRLLVIHGGIDNTVVWQQSLDFVKQCIDKDVLLDYFVYPTHEHNVGGKDRLHLMQTVTRYFDDFLK